MSLQSGKQPRMPPLRAVIMMDGDAQSLLLPDQHKHLRLAHRRIRPTVRIVFLAMKFGRDLGNLAQPWLCDGLFG